MLCFRRCLCDPLLNDYKYFAVEVCQCSGLFNDMTSGDAFYSLEGFSSSALFNYVTRDNVCYAVEGL